MALMIDEHGDVINEDSYSSRHRKPKISSKSILPDMAKVDLPDGIKQAAERVYGKMGSPVRKDSERRIMVFCCVLFAHAELDIICSPRELARKVGINDSTISTYVSKYSMNRVGYHPVQRFYSIGQHAELLMSRIEFDSKFAPLVMECAGRIARSPLTERNVQPDLVAAAIILYIANNLIGHSEGEVYQTALRSYILCSDKALPDMEGKIQMYDNVPSPL